MTRTVSPAPFGSPGLEFGNTTQPPYSANRPHGGQDHEWYNADPAGSQRTFAPVAGRVTSAFNDGGYHNGWGNYVDIEIPTLDDTSAKVRLAHHATGTVRVNVGDWVNVGDRIGTMGDTGEAGGVHLHEEFWLNGRRVDPLYYRTHDIPGTPSSAGGGDSTNSGNAAGSETDMALDQDAQNWLNGLGSSIISQTVEALAARIPPAVWAQPIQAQDANGRGVTKDGKPVAFRADGFAASSNAQIAALREVVATLAVGQGLDPDAILKAAEEGARKALQSLTLKAS